jgi:hypothetical protein
MFLLTDTFKSSIKAFVDRHTQEQHKSTHTGAAQALEIIHVQVQHKLLKARHLSAGNYLFNQL